MIRVIRYLLGDTLVSWLVSPLRCLTKLGVAGMLTAVALGILLAFAAMSGAIREQLESFGPRVIWLKENPHASHTRDDLPALLPETCTTLRLSHTNLVGNQWERQLPVSSYHSADLSALGLPPGLEDLYADGYLMTSRPYPAGTLLPVELNDRLLQVATMPHPEWATGHWHTEMILIAETSPWLESHHQAQHWTRIECHSMSEAFALTSLLRRASSTHFRQSSVYGADLLFNQLTALEQSRSRWRLALASLLIPGLSLILGALAILEFHQQQHLCALMRSFGVPWWVLWIRALLESCLLTALGAIAAAVPLLLYASDILQAFGMTDAQIRSVNWMTILSEDGIWVAAALLTGACLSSLPVAFGLRKPIGRVLS